MKINFLNNIIKNINCPLTKEERILLTKLKSCVISKRVCDYYKLHIKNNEYDDIDLIHKKLIRNIILADWHPINKNRVERRLFTFGNLSILWMEDTNEIVWLDNKEGYYPFKVDQEKKNWLNKELGINTYKMEKAV